MANATLSETVAQSLAREIIDGKLAAGERLDENSIALRYRVSRSPVRDALRQLAVTNLVEYAPRRGFSVTHIDPARLQDIYDALSEIEALCARFCALRASAMERVTLESIHAQAKAAAAKQSAEVYAKLNEELHRAIYAGAHNKTLETVVLDVRHRLDPFRSRIFFQRARLESSIKEHDLIVKAIIAQDPEKAAAAMRMHTAQTAANVIKLSSQPQAAVPSKAYGTKKTGGTRKTRR
jgi:DNA-binding GntR family transcriptional regulator